MKQVNLIYHHDTLWIDKNGNIRVSKYLPNGYLQDADGTTATQLFTHFIEIIPGKRLIWKLDNLKTFIEDKEFVHKVFVFEKEE